MQESLVDRVWDEMQKRVEEDLRAVVHYTPQSSAANLRSDVEDEYSATERLRVLDATIVRQLGLSDEVEDFNAGELDAFVRVFNTAWILSWRDPENVKSGFLVSLERDGSTATMDDLEYCIQFLEAEIQPEL